MFRDIDAECYLMIDGDDTYPAEFARQVIAPVFERNADMVVGDRLSSTYFTENKRPFHNFGNSLMRNLINGLFKGNVKDILTGYRAFSYRFVKTFPIVSKGFEIETEMTIHALDKNMNVENVVIDFRNRPEGSESKLNTYSDGAKVLMTVARLFKNYKPMEFFGLLSLVLFIVSLCFFIPIIITFGRTGLVPKIPTLIVVSTITVSAVLSLFSGLILSTIASKNKHDFEFRLTYSENEKRRLMREDK